ncbi:MAG TPA: hypothetical protein VLK24_11700 [Gaiellaceae bacterium]|nr:hypothetical protein [Gaiellaceae bacterium]
MTRTRTGVVTASFFVLAAAVALTLVLLAGKSSGSGPGFSSKAGGDAGETGNAAEVVREGPTSFEQWRAQSRTYPAKAIPTTVVARARATFNRIAARDATRLKHARRLLIDGHKWKLYGPTENATEPGVISFSGATNNTASRVTTLVADPDCNAHHCRLWAGVSGGGVWRTDNATAPNPEWKQISPEDLDQNSVGTLTLVPGNDHGHDWKDDGHGNGNGNGNGNGQDTLYLGTGEANRCTSGCEAGVGIYRSKDGGEHWQKLADRCVSTAIYPCATPGTDAFLGRGINSIVIDPRNSNHMLVGSALGVRGLSHVIGAGGTSRFTPGANEPGVYESSDGGATFKEVWDGTKPDAGISFGITDLGLDPLNPSVVYAAGFDAGVWRRDAGAASTSFQQVFKPQFNTGAGTDRTMIALTSKNGHTRIYLTDGTAAGGGPSDPLAANFWRTDNGQLPAATLLASQPPVLPVGTGCTPPDPATHTFPASYNAGWQCLTSRDTSNPYFPTQDFCWAQCWYDEEVYTPAGHPDTVYVIGAMQYDEQPCDTKGVGCGFGHDASGQGAGMSNGRAVLYSNTAGDPDPANGSRTFTDLTTDAQDTVAPWCAYAPYGIPWCRRASNSIHPDQHAIVINPGNPTQIFEGSDGGVISTSGTFANISSQCDEQGRDGATGGPVVGPDNVGCKRLLSRVPVQLSHINRNLSSTLQFINVAINPANSCEVMGGTQDNGTWSNTNNCKRDTFNQVIYGDGGNAVYDATMATWRANEFTSGAGDSNFRNGDPERWVVSTAPIRRSGEGPAFYWPQVGDPNPTPGSHPIYSGARHVWRTLAFGGGPATQAGAQPTAPNIPFMESNCQEFVTGASTLGCGDYRPMGGPYCDGLASTPSIPSCINQPGDLAGTFYGADRGGLVVSWVARDGADHGTVWAATGAGRLFVTHNGDASDPSTITWHRVDNPTSPTRYISGIYPDPANPKHAWITYSGFNAATPTTMGHVFEVTEQDAPGTGTFTNLNVESGTSAFPTPTSNGDLPVSDIVRDDATHTLYVGTDFGVLAGPNDGHSGWHTMKGMPRYEIMHLEIQPSSRVPTCSGGGNCKRVLYAATHSQGIWSLDLGPGHDDDD